MEQYINQMALQLMMAEQNNKGTTPLTKDYPDLTPELAYQVQLINIEKKLRDGQAIVGKKIGLTSKAMQEMMNVDQPDYGHLLNGMVVENNGFVLSHRVLQPKVESEIAFVLKNDLIGPGVTISDVLHATDYVLPAIEIVDSRIQDWKINLPDTIADNASSGLYVLGGQPVRVRDVDLTKLEMRLFKNNEMVGQGVGAASLGNPAYCVAWLANKLIEFGIFLKAGEVILSGALSGAIDAKPGDVFHTTIDVLGEVRVRF